MWAKELQVRINYTPSLVPDKELVLYCHWISTEERYQNCSRVNIIYCSCSVPFDIAVDGEREI